MQSHVFVETSESVSDGIEYHVSEQQPPANDATSTDGPQVTSTAGKELYMISTLTVFSL